MTDEQDRDPRFADHLESRLSDIAKAVSSSDSSVPLRVFFEAILNEQQRTISSAVREREKAIAALKEELETAIERGDSSLRENFSQQVSHLKEAIANAEKLGVARSQEIRKHIDIAIQLGAERLEAVHRELKLIMENTEKEIAKAEETSEKRFATLEDLRSQISNSERERVEQMSQQTSRFLPREVAEQQFNDIRRLVTELSDKLSKLV